MRQRDIDKIVEIIMASGIANKTQRAAICQRIKDWFHALASQSSKQ